MESIENVISRAKRIHFIGIGGAGMCPLAEILHSEGFNLTGSDNNESDTLKRIRALGIPVFLGHSPENVDGADMVVFTAALLPDNPELCAAREKGIPVFERCELFGAVTRRYNRCVGICGTHGKTTVTSMTVQILIGAGLDPSAVIGGKLPLTGTNGRVGASDILVCEACEYKNTYHSLSPSISVILNIDCDHMEFFKTEDNLKASFRHFADMSQTAVIYNGDDEKTVSALEGITGKELVTFGWTHINDYYPIDISFVNGAFPEFDVYRRGERLGRLSLAVPGEHNILNALAAVSVCMYLGASFEQCAEGLSSFRGAGRRFEILGKYNGAVIADDYAHHPRELEVTLDAASRMEYKRVWAVFQPFTFSRTELLLNEFAQALSIADRVVLTEIMGSREVNVSGIKTKDLADKIDGCVWFESFSQIADYLKSNIEQGDLVITLGCGDVYKIAHLILEGHE